jgi:hypothetical protein
VPTKFIDFTNLFAVLSGGACAEAVPYGPSLLTQSSSAYLSTHYKDTLHDAWTQVTTSDGVTTDFTIQWTFKSGTKTLSQRFADAVATGELVDYTVTDSANNVYQYTNVIWRFSSTSGNVIVDGKQNVN